jgi:5-methylcytosine-specific restriction protein A
LFLEVHHLLSLASGGEDTVFNAVAICPNYHRELHNGINAEEKKKYLINYLNKLRLTNN